MEKTININDWKLEEFCSSQNGKSRCYNQITISEDDIFIISESKRSMLPFSYMAKCPLCGNTFKIAEEKLPYNIRREIIQKHLNIKP